MVSAYGLELLIRKRHCLVLSQRISLGSLDGAAQRKECLLASFGAVAGSHCFGRFDNIFVAHEHGGFLFQVITNRHWEYTS